MQREAMQCEAMQREASSVKPKEVVPHGVRLIGDLLVFRKTSGTNQCLEYFIKTKQ